MWAQLSDVLINIFFIVIKINVTDLGYKKKKKKIWSLLEIRDTKVAYILGIKYENVVLIFTSLGFALMRTALVSTEF